MRALLRGERAASIGVMLGLLGLCCLLVASLGLNLAHHNDLDRLQRLIYQRCVQLTTPQNQARRVEIAEWTALAEREQDPTAARSYRHLADAMQAAVDASARNSCTQYRP